MPNFNFIRNKCNIKEEGKRENAKNTVDIHPVTLSQSHEND